MRLVCLVLLAGVSASAGEKVSYVDAWRILLTHQQSFDREFLEGNAFLEMNYLTGPMGDQQFNYDVPVHQSRAVEIVHESLQIGEKLADAPCGRWKAEFRRFVRSLEPTETSAYMQWLDRIKASSSVTGGCR